jgi:hypothetical protein
VLISSSTIDRSAAERAQLDAELAWYPVTLMSSIYPAFALGPGRRVFTRGAYRVQLDKYGAAADTHWIEAP